MKDLKIERGFLQFSLTNAPYNSVVDGLRLVDKGKPWKSHGTCPMTR